MNIRLLTLPSVRQTIDNIVEDLCAGRNVLLIIPKSQHHADIQHVLHSRAQENDRYVEKVSVTELSLRYQGGVAKISEFFGLDPPPSSLEALLNHPSFPEILFLDDVEALPQAKQGAWLNFFRRWAEFSKRIINTQAVSEIRTCCICLSSIALTGSIPESDVTLSVRWWWSIPSALEIRLACRLGSPEYSLENIWREHLLPSLSGNDIQLVEYLWDIITEPVEKIVQRLYQFAIERGWSVHKERWCAQLQQSRIRSIDGYMHLAPPSFLLTFWEEGALSATREYGMEIHSAALALLGKKREVEQRIWRGQATLILPLLDTIRLTLCESLTQRFGERWQLEWAFPKDQEEIEQVSETPLATQWGHLQCAVRNSPYKEQLKQELRIVVNGRSLRNKLAHYQTVSFREFKTFWEIWRKYEKYKLGN